MAVSAPWSSPAMRGTGATSATLSLSGVPTGQVVFALVCLSNNEPVTGPAFPAGWTVIATSQSYTLAWKVKAAETSVKATWTNAHQWVGHVFTYVGLDTTTPVEGAATAEYTTGSTSFVSPSVTPTNTNRWIVNAAFVFNAATRTFTPGAGLTERYDGTATVSPYPSFFWADTNAPVTQAAHTYTSTVSGSSNPVRVVSFALVPAVVRGSTTFNVDAQMDAKGHAGRFGSSTLSVDLDFEVAGVSMTPSAPLPVITTWQNGDDHDEDALNAQWRDPLLFLLKDTAPQIHAEFAGTAFNLTSPQAMPLDTVTMQRGDIYFVPGQSRIYIGVSGMYEGILQGGFALTTATTAYDFGTALYVNGVSRAICDDPICGDALSATQVFGGHFARVRLAAGDYVELVQYGHNWVSTHVKSTTSQDDRSFIKLWWAGV